MIRPKFRMEPVFDEDKPFVSGKYQVFECYSGIYLGGIAIAIGEKAVKEAAKFGGSGKTAMVALLPWAGPESSPVASQHGYRADLVAEHQVYRPYLKTLPFTERVARFLWRLGDLAFVVAGAVIAAVVSSKVV